MKVMSAVINDLQRTKLLIGQLSFEPIPLLILGKFVIVNLYFDLSFHYQVFIVSYIVNMAYGKAA